MNLDRVAQLVVKLTDVELATITRTFLIEVNLTPAWRIFRIRQLNTVLMFSRR